MGKLKKVFRKVKKGAKIGVAAAKLTAKLVNPYNRAKMVYKAVRGKGLILPGSKYIGPGNAMNKGKPRSSADAAAYRHDMAYDKLLKKGYSKKKVYGGFSDADQRLMHDSDVTTPDGLATYLGMSAKKGLYKLGLSGKRIRG
jgi:hypothetical protein